MHYTMWRCVKDGPPNRAIHCKNLQIPTEHIRRINTVYVDNILTHTTIPNMTIYQGSFRSGQELT